MTRGRIETGSAHPPVLRDTYVLGVPRWPTTLGSASELAAGASQPIKRPAVLKTLRAFFVANWISAKGRHLQTSEDRSDARAVPDS